MWLTSSAIIGLRCLLVPLAAALLVRSASGPLALFRGNASLLQHNRAQVFFYALAVLLSQTFFLLVPSPALLLLALLVTAVSLGLALTFFYRKAHLGLDVEPLVDRPDLALPLVQLVELDNEAAQKLAAEARHLIAERKAGR